MVKVLFLRRVSTVQCTLLHIRIVRRRLNTLFYGRTEFSAWHGSERKHRQQCCCGCHHVQFNWSYCFHQNTHYLFELLYNIHIQTAPIYSIVLYVCTTKTYNMCCVRILVADSAVQYGIYHASLLLVVMMVMVIIILMECDRIEKRQAAAETKTFHHFN